MCLLAGESVGFLRLETILCALDPAFLTVSEFHHHQTPHVWWQKDDSTNLSFSVAHKRSEHVPRLLQLAEGYGGVAHIDNNKKSAKLNPPVSEHGLTKYAVADRRWAKIWRFVFMGVTGIPPTNPLKSKGACSSVLNLIVGLISWQCRLAKSGTN